MKIPFSLSCILIGLCGTVLSLLAVNYNLSRKAASANLIYSFKGFMKTDWFAPTISAVAILMALIGLPYIPETWNGNPGMILIVFATIGYSGNDLVSRFFSVVNQRLNAAVDYKSNLADQVNNIPVGTRTPAAPVKDNKPADPPKPSDN